MFVKCISIDTVIIYKYSPLKEITKPTNLIGSMRYTGTSIRYTYGTVNLRSLHCPVYKLFLISVHEANHIRHARNLVGRNAPKEIKGNRTGKDGEDLHRSACLRPVKGVKEARWVGRLRVQQGSKENVSQAQRERQAEVCVLNQPRYPCCAQLLKCGPSRHEGQSGFGGAAARSVSQPLPAAGSQEGDLSSERISRTTVCLNEVMRTGNPICQQEPHIKYNNQDIMHNSSPVLKCPGIHKHVFQG